MSDLAARIASLPPEKRALLERRLLSVRARVAAAPSEISRRPAGPAPLSFAQRRLWFLDQLDPGSSLYNVPEAFVVRGPLDVRALEQALREVVRRHEVLRTGFGGDNGKPSARVADAFPPLAVTDLSTTPPSEREAKARLLAEAEASEPFDLGRPPLLRARVLRLDPEEHWLLLTMHHIVSDDWSMGVLYRELEELYGAFRSGRAPALPDLPIQYADYAAWQARWLTGDTLAAQLSYWKESLSGELPALDLPTDRPRPPSPSYRGADVRRVLPPRLSERVEALSRRENATLFMTLLAAFQVLLSRYCGQTDIPVGTPIAGRHRRETEDLIGFFVNTLVLRADLSDDPAFETLLRRTRDGALGAYAHQDLPFEKLVEELRPERSLSRTPLFQVMFELDNAPGEPLALPGVDVAPMELPDSSAKFDLRLLAIGEGDRLELVFEYATDLFDAATIERMAATFERLLEGVVADPAQAVSRLPLLSDREARTLLVDWNATTRDFPRDRTLHGLVADQVRRTPEAVAVEHGDDAVTYRELGRRARALAARLRRMGAGPGTIVGISLERSVNLVVGLLGILESGAAYLPLDPNYPDKRLEFMRSDAGIRILVTETALRGALPSGEGLEVVCLDEEDAEPFGPAPDAAGGAAFPESPAYVLYTSGSTGTPKGVVIPHRAIVNHMAWMLREFPLDAPDAVVQKTPLSFDASVWEFWAPLLSGARLVMAGREGHHDTADLIATIRQHGVTVLQVVPSLLTMLLEDRGFRECRSLQRVFCGGAPLARDV
ncbi:MAG TPA: condensation domain-containing protein, partial [Thermoanaerobaculia bacterium]